MTEWSNAEVLKTVGVRTMTFLSSEQFSLSLLFFKDIYKYLLTFRKSSCNYHNESIWLSKQTKKELNELILDELKKNQSIKVLK